MPVRAQAFVLPSHDHARLDECHGIVPARPQPGQPRPQQAIRGRHLWAVDHLLIDGELMPQREVF
jgi:hypothetical protein